MADLVRAAEEIRNFARRFSGLLEVAATLEELNTLEQRAAAADARKAQVEALAATAQADAEQKAAEAAAAKAEADEARNERVRLVTEANAEAARIVARANERAAEIATAAQAQADTLRDQVRTMQAEVADLRTQRDAAESALREQQGELNRLRAEAARFAAGGQP
jgi:colicin import membrane protein